MRRIGRILSQFLFNTYNGNHWLFKDKNLLNSVQICIAEIDLVLREEINLIKFLSEIR